MKLSRKISIISETRSDKISDTQKIIDSALKILEANKLVSISTVDKKTTQPHSCYLFYVFDDQLRIYFWTDPNSQHSLHIKENNRVAANITDTSQQFGTMLHGLQIKGTARHLRISELLVAGTLYFKRFPLVSTFVKHPRQLNSKKLESKLYVLEISHIKVFDESVFGKEVYKTIIIKR